MRVVTTVLSLFLFASFPVLAEPDLCQRQYQLDVTACTQNARPGLELARCLEEAREARKACQEGNTTPVANAGEDQTVQIGDLALDPSASVRLRSWGAAFEAFRQLPLLGHGVTGFGFIDAQYFRILAECGLLGLLSFGALVILLLWHTWRAGSRLSTPLWRGMSAGFLAALVGLLVHAIGANTFIIVRIMEPFWLFAGLVMVAPLIEESEALQGGSDGIA